MIRWLSGATDQRRQYNGDRSREALDNVVRILDHHRHHKTPKRVEQDRHPHGIVVPARARQNSGRGWHHATENGGTHHNTDQHSTMEVGRDLRNITEDLRHRPYETARAPGKAVLRTTSASALQYKELQARQERSMTLSPLLRDSTITASLMTSHISEICFGRSSGSQKDNVKREPPTSTLTEKYNLDMYRAGAISNTVPIFLPRKRPRATRINNGLTRRRIHSSTQLPRPCTRRTSPRASPQT